MKNGVRSPQAQREELSQKRQTLEKKALTTNKKTLGPILIFSTPQLQTRGDCTHFSTLVLSRLTTRKHKPLLALRRCWNRLLWS